jgi:hypothetical protein
MIRHWKNTDIRSHHNLISCEFAYINYLHKDANLRDRSQRWVKRLWQTREAPKLKKKNIKKNYKTYLQTVHPKTNACMSAVYN